jgi:ADP-heptose:LPS heptosyltransferase
MLKSKKYSVDVWCKNTEPYLNNPNIDNMYIIENNNIPIPTLFYPWGHFMVGNLLAGVSHPNSHVVDYISANLFRSVFLARDKTLDLYWTGQHVEFARSALLPVKLVGGVDKVRKPVLAMSPVIGWPSRTMPLEWYVEIATRVRAFGYKVVLVGKEIDPRSIGADNEKLYKNENKGLYDHEAIPHDLCLYNKTSLHELGAVYDQCDVILTTETGHLPIAGCCNNPHIVYAGQLIHPEFRMPYRRGSQSFRSTIVHTKGEYYPVYARMLEAGIRLTDIETRPADAHEVAGACIDALSIAETELNYGERL